MSDAALAACLLAVDPGGLGGMAIRARHGPAVTSLLEMLRGLLPKDAPFRRAPLGIADGRLLGGLDLAATLAAGRPVIERGLLAEADGGCLVLPMAERLSTAAAARLSALLDTGFVAVERDGFALRQESRVAFVALDEGLDADERPPQALLDRLALHVDLDGVSGSETIAAPFDAAAVAQARAALPAIECDDAMLRAFCHAAMALGIVSVRAPMLALRAARAHAALSGRQQVIDADAEVAARLVLAARATRLPAAQDQDQPQDQTDNDREPEPPPPEPPQNDTEPDEADDDASGGDLDMVLDAARAAIPKGLLALLQSAAGKDARGAAGRAGVERRDARRGRPAGSKRGDPSGGDRLDVVETLRAAAPWQRLRRSQAEGAPRVIVRRDDFRVRRHKHRSETVTIFVVDASGSSALHRLREAKGAVELLLADCYVRRDQVALIAFRGRAAELILPPTRSLTRAKRLLSALPGGGGTPMAAALDAAAALADGVRRKGMTPSIVLLTDGRSNVGRDGVGGRDHAEKDAHDAARAYRTLRLAALLVDISPSPGPAGERLAAEMAARYVALPRADAAGISAAVRLATASQAESVNYR